MRNVIDYLVLEHVLDLLCVPLRFLVSFKFFVFFFSKHLLLWFFLKLRSPYRLKFLKNPVRFACDILCIGNVKM